MPNWTRNSLLTEQTRRLQIRSSLADWSRAALKLEPAAHHHLLIEHLEAVSAGAIDRLMLLLPPGSAKSTYASLAFPPWWLSRHPTSHVIATSHTGGLARHFGRGVRGLINDHGPRLGYTLARDDRAAHRFTTTRGGTYYATGVRGPVTGRRADLVLIDDPVKSAAEADSRAARDHLWDWFRSDITTRLKPGGRMVLIMTRWHPDDLGGRVLEGGDRWRVVRLPALAEGADPLGRPEGAALWPAWENEEALARKRLALGERAFAALFQQTPRTRVGRLFRPDRMPLLDTTSPGTAIRAWDLAASTDRTADYTVGLKLLRTEDGLFQVADIVRLQGAPETVLAAMLATAKQDGPAVTVALPQDPGQAGKAQVQWFTAALAGHRVLSSPETGNKQTRAGPVASQVNAGTVSVLQAPWTAPFLDELRDFPSGAKDDQVDALSRAFTVLLDVAAPARRARVGVLGR